MFGSVLACETSQVDAEALTKRITEMEALAEQVAVESLKEHGVPAGLIGQYLSDAQIEAIVTRVQTEHDERAQIPKDQRPVRKESCPKHERVPTALVDGGDPEAVRNFLRERNELTKENIKKAIFKNVELSESEINAILANVFSRLNQDLLQAFVSNEITVEDRNALFTQFREAGTHLQHALATLKVTAIKDKIERSEQWKIIQGEVLPQMKERAEAERRSIKEISLVFRTNNLLDLYQGRYSGTCFGDHPSDMSRDDIFAAKILKDGELAGSLLFNIQGGQLIMIGFDPSESLVGQLDESKQHELIDKTMQRVYEFASENKLKLLLTEQASGLSNRTGFEDYIMGKYATETTQTLEPRTYHPYYRYQVTSAREVKPFDEIEAARTP